MNALQPMSCSVSREAADLGWGRAAEVVALPNLSLWLDARPIAGIHPKISSRHFWN